MSTSLWYYAKNGQQLGPFRFKQLRQMAQAGILSSDDFVRREEETEWRLVTDVPELRSLVRSSSRTRSTGINSRTTTPDSKLTFWETFAGSMDAIYDLAAQIAGWGCGILILFCVLMMVLGLFCNKDQKPAPPRPALPVLVSFRTSDVGKGMVMQITNTSAAPLNGISLVVTSVGGAKAGQIARTLMKPIEPNITWEIGWVELDGWELQPGETVKILHATGLYQSLEVTVPTKAASR